MQNEDANKQQNEKLSPIKLSQINAKNLLRLMGANKNFKRNSVMNLSGGCVKMVQFHAKFIMEYFFFE